MARLRQQNVNNYRASGNISAEFESIIRYINSAEIGNKTLAELLDQLFDDDGAVDGIVELRLDADAGLQYRSGEYDDDEEGWETIVALADIRGPAGINVGEIQGPLFYNFQEYVATAAQEVFEYTFDEDNDELMVWHNGLLLSTAAYTADSENDTVTLDVAADEDDDVAIASVRSTAVTDYLRSDFTATAAQTTFAFTHDAEATLMVYRNGLLQKAGGGNDYTSNATTDTVTFTSGLNLNDRVVILTVENLSAQTVGGIMLEDEYTDANGLITYDKLAIEADEIPQAKVDGLTTDIASKATLTVSASAPVGPAHGDLWLDTSTDPQTLKFYDDTEWVLTSPESAIPSFTTADANLVIKVNGTGTAFELGTVDVTSLVPKTYMGAANGVASLDSTGKLPSGQLPSILSRQMIPYAKASTVADATYVIQRLFQCIIEITGVTRKSSAGTATLQLAVDGVGIGSTFAISSTAADTVIDPGIEVDALTASKRLGLIVSSQSSLADVELSVACRVVTSV